MTALPDIHKEGEHAPIRKVGIRNYKKILYMMNIPAQAEISTYVNLKEGRGVHMSRFVTAISRFDKISSKSIGIYLKDVKQLQQAEVSFLTLRFEKEVMDQFLPFQIDSNSKSTYHNITFKFQIIATCPCSLELCRSQKKGVPHMQRGFITTSVAVRFIEDIVPVVVSCMSEFADLLPQSFVKRPAEHQIAVNCEKNPVFVEDVVRRAKAAIDSLDVVQDFYVVAEHEESIHSHNAVAVDSKYDPVSHPME